MPMYNLVEYTKNYSKTSGRLWNYYKDILPDPITNSESFKDKTSITGKHLKNVLMMKTQKKLNICSIKAS